MSIQIILISITYGLSYLFMRGITKLINIDAVTGLVWGFNFIFGMLFAINIKQIMNWLRKIKLIKRKYTNEYMLNRITGVVFDYMIVASIMSINIEMLVNTGLWIGLLVITTIGGIVTIVTCVIRLKECIQSTNIKRCSFIGNLAEQLQ